MHAEQPETGARPAEVGTGEPFRLLVPLTGVSHPVVIAAPHGGRDYSAALLAAMRHPVEASLRLEDRHIDSLAVSVARETGAALLVADAPRAMIDLNRAEDDIDWSMVRGPERGRGGHSLANRRARMGLGLVPRRLSGLGEIWRGPLESETIDARIAKVHRPYHRTLADTLQRTCDTWGIAVLLDLHSMPPLIDRRSLGVAPDFVVGDRFGCSCDPRLAATALQYFADHARPVSHNRPYSGGYVLDRHGQPARGIHALQLEVCRTLYLDHRLEEPSARFASVARLLTGLVDSLAETATGMADRHGTDMPQAAE